MVTREIKVNFDLLMLQFMLFDLDNYSFDKDVICKINELMDVVQKKLYGNIDFNIGGVMDKEIIVRYKEN